MAPERIATDDELLRSIFEATGGRWRGVAVHRLARRLSIVIDSGTGEFEIEARPEAPGVPAYRSQGGLAWSYRRDGPLPAAEQSLLDAAIAVLSKRLDPAVFHGPPSRPDHPFTAARIALLESAAALPSGAIEAFRRDGFVVLRGVLDGGLLRALRPLVLPALRRRWNGAGGIASGDPHVSDAYARAFKQVVNLSADAPEFLPFARAPRFGRVAADLAGVDSVRLFCEDWLTKLPGADTTPWHQDAAVYPFGTVPSITLWIPLQVVDSSTGGPRYARGSHRAGLTPVENINDVSETLYAGRIEELGLEVVTIPRLRPGDVVAHDGLTVHGANAHHGHEPRIALALHCFADGARIAPASTPTQEHMLRVFGGGLEPGAVADSPHWPVLHPPAVPRIAVSKTPAQAWRLRGVVLPEGGPQRDLWIASGRWRMSPVPGARNLDVADAFVLPGLVDAHAHISWPHERSDPADDPAFMDAQRARHAAAGVCVLRDMGSAGDVILDLHEVDGLPRIHAAGRLILREDRWPFTNTPPERLMEQCLERLDRGARWVKLFADWTDDFGGRWNTGFSETDQLTYDVPTLAAAVVAVHEAGARVAAHCFSAAGAAAAVAAGCDSLEHGWGVDQPLLEIMAQRRIAWVPLVGIATAMWRAAQRDGQRERADWIERAMVRLGTLLPLAVRLGVPVMAGTDWFPEVTVAEEVAELVDLGVPAVEAVAGASWSARAWLGEPGVEEGAPADALVCRGDPREDPRRLREPAAIFLSGSFTNPAQPSRTRPFPLWRERSATLGSR